MQSQIYFKEDINYSSDMEESNQNDVMRNFPIISSIALRQKRFSNHSSGLIILGKK
jgi:hypothetical protein